MSSISPGVFLAADVTTTLTMRRRLVIGGLGALTPVLLSLLVVDFRVVVQSTDQIAIIGYVTRVVVLFGLGALAAWLHKQEWEETKLFQLGMVAPALLTTMINGAQANPSDVTRGPNVPTVAISSVFVTPLYAQAEDQRIYSFYDGPPPANKASRFFRGLVGYSEQGTYFVALTDEVFTDSVAAFRRLRDVRQLDDDFGDAHVFHSPAREGEYVIVLGGWLTEKRARMLIREAREDRLDAAAFPDMSAGAIFSNTKMSSQRPAPR